MSLDDMIDGMKKEGQNFLQRNGNVFYSAFGVAFGILDGLLYSVPQSVPGALIQSYLIFGLVMPTIDTFIMSSRLPDQKSKDQFRNYCYFEKGPENTAAFVIPYLAISNAVYAIKRGIFG